MNPLTGQLIASILPSAPLDVFEADLPDLTQLAADKAAQLLGGFGKYGSTKAEPYTSKMDESGSFISDPKALADAKIAELGNMLKDYGQSKAPPYFDSISALQEKLPLVARLPIEQLPPFDASANAIVAQSPLAIQSHIAVKIEGLASPEIPTLLPLSQALNITEIAMMNEIGQPLAGEPYEIALSNGQQLKGITDENGVAQVAAAINGPCLLSLPNMDKSAW